jgi:hypothetical protein
MSEQHEDHGCDHVHARTRTIGVIHGEDCRVIIEHVYLPDGSFTCDECGKPGHDPGFVRLVIVQDGEEDGKPFVAVADLEPDEGLAVINRVQRAVNLVYESAEDSPDFEREAGKLEIVREGKEP